MKKFMDFTKASDRRRLQEALELTGYPIAIKFEKDDGSTRQLRVTLNKRALPRELSNTTINTPRSLFIKAFDTDAQQLKTIRWNKIIEVDTQLSNNSNRTQAVAAPVAVSTAPIPTAKPAPFAATPDLLNDLKAAGFQNGKPINDAMLARFANIRETRVRRECQVEVSILKDQIAKASFALNPTK